MQNQLRYIEESIERVHGDTQYIANEVNGRQATTKHSRAADDADPAPSRKRRAHDDAQTTLLSSAFGASATSMLLPGLKSNWTLSLTPSGLRIDTDIVSLNDLHDILLSGLSQFHSKRDLQADQESLKPLKPGGEASVYASTPSSSFSMPPSSPSLPQRPVSPSSSMSSNAVVVKHNRLYRSKDIVFPLYSAWESSNSNSDGDNGSGVGTSSGKKRELQSTMAAAAAAAMACRRAAVECSNGQQHQRQKPYEVQTEQQDTKLPQPSSSQKLPSGELLDQLLKIYEECFLCLPLPDIDQFIHECKSRTCCPLLLNAMLSWSARHAAIYHGVFVGQDPNTVGEQFFETAKELLKDRFLIPSTRTVHALLLMYIYSIGKTGPDRAQAESEAYTFLGLATRMCLDLGLHDDEDDQSNGNTSDKRKHPPPDAIEREKRCRLFAAAEFLETLCAAHSDKPVMFPTTDTAPEAMPHEQGERRYRTEFTVHRHKINQIYRRMHQSVCSKHDTKPLLFATVSGLEKELKDWYAALPDYFHYRPQACWSTGSFREQACLKLNFEYHFQMCQLYSIFLPPTNAHQHATSTIALLSLRLCVHGADAITDLLECWAQLRQPWCHFTLDTLVMACMIYSRLSHSNEANHATRQLRRILAVLLRAPVRHHKYIRTLISRIKRQLKNKGTAEEEENSNDDEEEEEEANDTTLARSAPAAPAPVASQAPYSASAALHPHLAPPSAPPAPPVGPSPSVPTSVQPLNMPAADLHVPSWPNVLSEEDWAWLKQPSVIDWAAHTDMDLFRFADFVYTPTMDPTLQQPPVSSSSPSETRLFHWH